MDAVGEAREPGAGPQPRRAEDETMKASIQWHEECLARSTESRERMLDELRRLTENLKRIRLENAFHAAQIAEAKRRGLTEFDADRLMRKVKR